MKTIDNKMKLELKHIAPYLPYGLTCNIMGEHKEDGTPHVFILKGICGQWINTNSTRRTAGDHLLLDCFPLLRPLSKLTDSITHNGQTFIPMVELLRLKECNFFSKDPLIKQCTANFIPEIVTCKQTFYESFSYSQVEYLVRTGNMGTLVYQFSYDNRFDRFSLHDTTRDKNLGVGHQLQLFEKLYEWKFDTFGLIENKLALPIQD